VSSIGDSSLFQADYSTLWDQIHEKLFSHFVFLYGELAVDEMKRISTCTQLTLDCARFFVGLAASVDCGGLV
jgi:hypothetical protein